MKREIREKRNQLYKQSCMLKKAGMEEKDFKKSQELYKEQDKIYKQWEFLKGLSIAIDNAKGEK